MRTAAQLREVFNTTFDRLPKIVQSKINDFWLKYKILRENSDADARLRPHLGSNVSIGQSKPSPSLCAGTDGLSFYVKDTIADRAPDEMLAAILAHELAHAYRCATVGYPLPIAQLYLGTREHEEDVVDELIRKWGFDERKLRNWIVENGEAFDLA
jgi:hypothetical protein